MGRQDTTGQAAPGRIARTQALALAHELRVALLTVFAQSGLVNLLMLTAPLFMLQVYDRVLPSRSLATLAGLAGIAVLLFVMQSCLEVLRARMLSRVGRHIDERLAGRLFAELLRRAGDPGRREQGPQVLRDLDTVRGFLGSMACTAFFDLPWVPIYVGVCLLFHPWIGVMVAAGALLLCGLALVTDLSTAGPTRAALEAGRDRRAFTDLAARAAPLVAALGMRARVTALWEEHHRRDLDRAGAGNDRAIAFGSLSRLLRTILQSAILAIGAFLVVRDEATPGVMLAATILSARALAPVDLAIANWKSVAATRQAWIRLVAYLPCVVPAAPTSLPPPRESLRVTALSLTAPGTETLVLHDVNFALGAGAALGIIGPSGSGKSSLARALVGIDRPARGAIRLDGATADQWDPDVLGRALGYLPQDVDFLDGTVAQNIARFDANPDPEALRAAARAAGIHEVILALPGGYDAKLGPGGRGLSGGQRQRVGLARALYGDPFLVVLDEPNSNLDVAGERALSAAVRAVRARGGIAIVIAHRPSALAAVDRILVVNEGRVQMYGPRDDVLARLDALTRAVPARVA